MYHWNINNTNPTIKQEEDQQNTVLVLDRQPIRRMNLVYWGFWLDSFGVWVPKFMCNNGPKCAIKIFILKIWISVHTKRLLHDIFHIGPGISLRLPYQAWQWNWRADMDRGLIPGMIWKISCHNLFITYFTLTFSKHWLLYCKKDLLFNLQIFCFESGLKNIPSNVDLYNDVRNCKIYPRCWHLNGNSYSTQRIRLS